jgi:hypothetical protein
MILKYNQEKELWEQVKTRKLKVDLTLEMEDCFTLEVIEGIKEKNHLKTDEQLVNYFKEQIILAGKADFFAQKLCVSRAKIKEILNISMVEDNE